MKIVIYIDTEPYSGGGIQSINYALQFEEVIKSTENNYEILTSNKNTFKLLSKNTKVILTKSKFIDKIFLLLKDSTLFKFIFKKFKFISSFEKSLLNRDVDLILFTSPSSKCLLLDKINYILCVWDICHRNNIEFPEIKSNREHEIREDFYKYSLKKAYRIIVDTIELSQDIHFYYNIKIQRLLTIPFNINSNLKKFKKDNITVKKIINGKYFLYPAQFWPHKNHITLLEAFKEINNKDISLVLCGGDQGNLNFINKFIAKNNLSQNTHIFNYIDDEKLYSLYTNCLCLVMPTLFGYSNIPPLEAWFFNKPVIYNEEFSLRFKEKGLYKVDPLDKWSIVEAINKVIHLSDEENRFSNSENYEINSKEVHKGLIKLKKSISEFEKILKCWK